MQFLTKKFEKKFTNFNVDFIWKYAREVPPKYQTLRARCLVDLSRSAGMFAEDDRSEEKQTSDTETEHENNEDIATDTDNQISNKKAKRATMAPSQSSRNLAPQKNCQYVRTTMPSKRVMLQLKKNLTQMPKMKMCFIIMQGK